MASFYNADTFTSADPSSDQPALKRHKGHGKQTIKGNQHAEVVAAAGSRPSFTKVITGKTTHHSAYCCRLNLPRKFCEEHSIPRHVTMTDATGTRVWKMRLQVRHASPGYTISNGWREFSYDHSLKLHDALVFTLVSPSHFRVAFAAANGRRQRPMHPTITEGTGYPWRQNHSRKACLSATPLLNHLQSEYVVTAAEEETVQQQNLDTNVDSVLANAAANMKGRSSDDMVEKPFNSPKVRCCPDCKKPKMVAVKAENLF